MKDMFKLGALAVFFFSLILGGFWVAIGSLVVMGVVALILVS